MGIFSNISNNYFFLRNDFIGFSINPFSILQFLLHVVIAGSVFIIFYLLGDKLRRLFFNENKEFTHFINIALGFITVGTGIGILGIFSLLYSWVLAVYLLAVLLFAFYPFSLKKFREITYQNFIKLIRFGKNFYVWGVFLFIIIAFLRLMTPEIAEDGYHTDLPTLYLTSHTTIYENRDRLHVIPYPQLAEMIYVIPVFLHDKEAARFIHFGFYLAIICLLFSIQRVNKSSFTKFAPLLFVTAPLVIRYSPSQYVDFFMVFPILLSAILLQKNMSKKTIVLSGIVFGAALSVKMWTLIYLPTLLIYFVILNRRSKLPRLFMKSALFVLSTIAAPLLWFIRAFVITGNPLYPIFTKLEYLEISHPVLSSPSYFGLNFGMFALQNMIVYSPLFFVGILFFLLNFKEAYKLVKRFSFAIFFLLLMGEQLIVKLSLGRYLIAWYTVSVVIISAGIVAVSKNLFAQSFLVILYCILFFYYFLNTLFILPYGFGWADKNAYLTRVLFRDFVSYYDFDHLFGNQITDKDLVATYGVGSYYYANFKYIDIGYIFDNKSRSFDLLKKRGVTKLFIQGGDINWFCKILALTHCDKNKVKLLATYPADLKKYNLYLIQY